MYNFLRICTIVIFFLSVNFASGFLHFSFAENTQAQLSDLAQKGINYFEKQEWQKAARLFVSVLLLEPSHPVPKPYLNKIIKHGVDYPRHDKLLLGQFIELIDYIKFLNQRIYVLEKNSTELISYVLHKTQYNDFVVNEVTHIEARMLKSLAKLDYQELTNNILESNMTLEQVNKMLVERKKNKVSLMVALQEIEKDLRKIKMKNIYPPKTILSLTKSGETNNQIQDIQDQLSEKDKQILEQEENLSQINTEFNDVQQNFKKLQGRLKKMDVKIVDLTKDIAGMSLELYEKGKVLSNKSDQINRLEENLKETKERLILAQRIIEEKNEIIDRFERKNLDGSFSPSFGDIEKSKEKIVLFKEPQNFKHSDIPQVGLLLRRINDLESQIQDLQNKYLKLGLSLKDKDNEISQLNEMIHLKNNKITHLKKAFLLKEHKLSEVENILEIYRGKLGDTSLFLKRNEQKLKYLQQELLNLKTQSYQQKRSGKENDFNQKINQLINYHFLPKKK